VIFRYANDEMIPQDPTSLPASPPFITSSSSSRYDNGNGDDEGGDHSMSSGDSAVVAVIPWDAIESHQPPHMGEEYL
jgi:hypothetical protein